MDFVLSSSVETHAAAVVITSPVTEISTGDNIVAQAELVGTVITEPLENAVTAELSGTVIDGAYNPSLSLTGEANEGGDITLLGNVAEDEPDTSVDLTLLGNSNTEADVSIDLLVVGKIFSASPYYAEKLVVVEGDTNNTSITLDSFVSQDGDTNIYGTVIETDTAPSVDVVSPLTIFSGDLLSNFDISSDVITMDYNANVTLAAYSALLTVPFQQTNDVIIGDGTTLSLLTSIENLNFMLTTDIADSGSIRYEVADIDRNLQEGRLRIFPNEWTLSYINNPLDTSGNMNTVSSFLVPILENTYGAEIFNKISLITARNPITGLLYNFVFQDGYTTPSGTMNDFELCYQEEGVFYPVPFMVKSVTNEELEIIWDLEQEI